MSQVTINLVTWNGGKYINDCLRSVYAQTFKDFSIFIIDNGSSDDTVAIIREQYPQLKVIQHKENTGFAKAHNQAIHWTKADYILCLNQDIILDKDFLQALVDFMEKNPQAGSVSGKILRLQEGQKTKYIDSLGLKVYKSYRAIDIASGELDEGQYDTIEEVFGVSGALPLYRRKALDSVCYKNEYFDESFFSYKEDVDLAHRLLTAGWKSWRVPAAIGYHDRTVTTPINKLTVMKVAKNRIKKSKFSKYLSYRNHLYFIYKNLPSFHLNFLWPVFWYELVKFIYVFIFEMQNLKAWKEFFINKKELKAKRALIQKNKRITIEEISAWLKR